MRIIGGENKGVRLTALGAGDPRAALRPTPDRVRESLFSMLASRGRPAEGDRVLDLFCGTGALGLEALSRGAAHCTFVDTGRKALALTRKNIALTRRTGQANVLSADATRGVAGGPFDLAFLDPPYGRDLAAPTLAALRDSLAEDALVVVEEGQKIETLTGFTLLGHRKFGDTHVHLLEPS